MEHFSDTPSSSNSSHDPYHNDLTRTQRKYDETVEIVEEVADDAAEDPAAIVDDEADDAAASISNERPALRLAVTATLICQKNNLRLLQPQMDKKIESIGVHSVRIGYISKRNYDDDKVRDLTTLS